MNTQDTICAIATATGGAIGVIRISGEKSISIAAKIFKPAGLNYRPLEARKANTVTFGRITDENGDTVDEVLLSVFKAPHSYTGEDSVEISCHGSAYILQRVIQLLIAHGCRQADAGEYTRRAFMNGKMDLSQAEAVADLIASSSAATHRMAMSQMRGDFSLKLSELRKKLLHLTSLMELELDFSDHEELEFADRTELRTLTDRIEHVIKDLTNSFTLGNAIKNGVPVAIIGETNAGKSTLLNALVGEERAIVSDIHGTTRDVIEDTVNIGGIVFRFIDTAGIRDTRDEVEALGIERTFQKIKQASIVLWLIDATLATTQINHLKDKILPICKDKHLIIVMNKTDLTDRQDIPTNILYSPDSTNSADEYLCQSYFHNSTEESFVHPISTIHISAKEQTNIQALREMLHSSIEPTLTPQNDIIVSNLRHYEALMRAHDAILRVQNGLTNQASTDLVAQDLRDCISAIAEITGGEITTTETLSNIFSHFCVGK